MNRSATSETSAVTYALKVYGAQVNTLSIEMVPNINLLRPSTLDDVLPLFNVHILITYVAILLRPDRLCATWPDNDDEQSTPLLVFYARLPNEDTAEESVPVTDGEAATAPITLLIQDNWKLTKPMLIRYMLPSRELKHNNLRRSVADAFSPTYIL